MENCAQEQKQEIAAVWNQQVKEAIGKAFFRTGVSYAKDTVDRIYKLLDGYSNEWAAHYTKACKATHVKGEQSDEVLDLRMGCLRKRMAEFGAFVKVFARADAGVVRNAVKASSSLMGINACADEKALRATYPPPKTDQAKNRVAAIREKLAAVKAMNKTGKYLEGLYLAEKLEKDANAIDYRPVQAEVLYQLGDLLDRSGEYKEAENALHDAARAAGESGNAQLVAKAMVMLVWVVGYEQARPEESLFIARDALVVIELGRGDDDVRAQLLNNMGIVSWRQAEFDKALDYHLKALAIKEKSLGPEHPGVAISLNNLGVVLRQQGQYEKALRNYRKALAIQKRALGPEHPDVALALDNMGVVFSVQGEYEKALGYHRKALAIRENALGGEHPNVAWSLDNIGKALQTKREYKESLEYYMKSKKIYENAFGLEHPFLAWPLNGIGSVFVSLGKPNQALESLERLVSICKRKICEPESYGRGLFALARALVATNRNKDRAIKLAKQAREVFIKNPKAFKKEIEEVNTWLKKHGASKLAKKTQQ